MDIGTRIRELREKRGMDQITLAAKAGITQSYLSRLELNKHTPSYPILEKLAEALGVIDKGFFFGAADTVNIPLTDLLNNLTPEDREFLLHDDDAKGYITLGRELAEQGIDPENLRDLINLFRSRKKSNNE